MKKLNVVIARDHREAKDITASWGLVCGETFFVLANQSETNRGVSMEGKRVYRERRQVEEHPEPAS